MSVDSHEVHGRMSKTRYVRTEQTPKKWHKNPDCPYAAQATELVEVSPDELRYDVTACTNCADGFDARNFSPEATDE